MTSSLIINKATHTLGTKGRFIVVRFKVEHTGTP